MDKAPFLSIVVLSEWICTHLLTHTLDGIFAQKKQNFEVILILSPQAERESKIIESYRRFLSHLYVALSSNVSHMMNCGTKFARGEYLQFITAGDYYLSAYATEKIEDFCGEKNLPDSISSGFLLRKQGKILHVSFEEITKLKFTGGIFQRITQTFILRKEIIERLGGFRFEHNIQGLDMILRIYFRKESHCENLNVVLIEHEICPAILPKVLAKDLLMVVKDILGWPRFIRFLFWQKPSQIFFAFRDLLCR